MVNGVARNFTDVGGFLANMQEGNILLLRYTACPQQLIQLVDAGARNEGWGPAGVAVSATEMSTPLLAGLR